MSDQNHTLPPMGKKESVNISSKIIPAVIVIFITAAVLLLMAKFKPDIDKKDDAQIVQTVETINIRAVDFVIPITTEGMVLPKTSIAFSSEISGKIISVATQFSNGGRFTAGDILVKVDPLDYKLAITRAQANVSAKIASLDLEQAKSDLAKTDWKKYGKKGQPTALNLNLPQVASAKAALAGAKADLLLAKRNLAKTEVIAPFDGVIFTKNVDVGQFVAIGTTLATIASTQTAEIRVALSDEQLNKSGLNTSIANIAVKIRSEETNNIQWQGRVAQIEAQRDARTLMNFVVIEVEQPFSQQSIPLRFNTFVEVEFNGQTLHSVYPMARNYMMLNHKVKILDSQLQLAIRSVEVGYADDSRFYITSGLNSTDQVIVTQLPGLKSGSQLKLEDKHNKLSENDVN